jgi:hypothetical protein
MIKRRVNVKLNFRKTILIIGGSILLLIVFGFYFMSMDRLEARINLLLYGRLASAEDWIYLKGKQT